MKFIRQKLTSSALLLVGILIRPAAAQAQAGAVRPPVPISASNHSLGMDFTLPDQAWELRAWSSGTYLRHPNGPQITIADSYLSGTLAEAYETQKAVITRLSPGYQFLRENEKLTFPGGVEAMSFTTKDPGRLTLQRQILFQINQQTFVIKFFLREANLAGIKNDLTAFLKSISFRKPENKGMTIHHAGIGAAMTTPNSTWRVEVKVEKLSASISQPVVKFSRLLPEEYTAYATLVNASHHPGASLDLAFQDHLNVSREDNPDATIISSGRLIPLSTTQAMELSFTNPQNEEGSGFTVFRHLLFLQNGICRELQFVFPDAKFQDVKADFSSILASVTVDP